MNWLRAIRQRWRGFEHSAPTVPVADETTSQLTALAEELAALQADHSALVRRLARLEELLTESGALPRS